MAVPLVAPIVASALSWLLREVVLKFVIMAVLFAVVSELMPLVLGYVAPFIAPAGLTDVFRQIPPGVWFFWDAFRLDYGIPLMLSALVARFCIRRLPVVG